MNYNAVLLLVRPANIITAIADIIAGIAISGLLSPPFGDSYVLAYTIGLLIISTSSLYGGGIVFNDIFDIEQDRINRPERVLPSGKISLKEATIIGILLFCTGVLTAFSVSFVSGILALVIVILALLYNYYSKHNRIAGPLNMGACRGANLLLGISAKPEALYDYWMLAFVSAIFIAAVTLTAQKETEAKNKRAIVTALLLDFLVFASFFLMYKYLRLSLQSALVFILLWYMMNLIAKIKAVKTNKPSTVQKAVKTGVLSLILLDAAYTAGFSSVTSALPVLLLLPLSLYLAKKYPVS